MSPTHNNQNGLGGPKREGGGPLKSPHRTDFQEALLAMLLPLGVYETSSQCSPSLEFFLF